MDYLTTIKGLLPYQSEATLNFYINQATQDFLNLTNLKEVPEKAQYVIIQMVLYYVNQFGNEGITSYSASGVKYQFSTALPPNILLQIGGFIFISW